MTLAGVLAFAAVRGGFAVAVALAGMHVVAMHFVAGSNGFAAFPDAIRRDTDILEITRTWTFTSADRLRSD